MDREAIIKAAHGAQHDAGSLAWFGSKVDEELAEGKPQDPVVLAVANAIRSADDLQDVSVTLAFYAKELKRAADAVNALYEQECSKKS